MRKKSRIKPFLKKIEKFWLANPDLRFGQVVRILRDNTLVDGKDYYKEDKQYEKYLNDLLDI